MTRGGHDAASPHRAATTNTMVSVAECFVNNAAEDPLISLSPPSDALQLLATAPGPPCLVKHGPLFCIASPLTTIESCTSSCKNDTSSAASNDDATKCKRDAPASLGEDHYTDGQDPADARSSRGNIDLCVEQNDEEHSTPGSNGPCCEIRDDVQGSFSRDADRFLVETEDDRGPSRDKDRPLERRPDKCNPFSEELEYLFDETEDDNLYFHNTIASIWSTISIDVDDACTMISVRSNGEESVAASPDEEEEVKVQEEEDEEEVEEEEEEENEDDDPASAVVETSPSGNLVDDNDSTQDIEEESSGKAHRGDANESTQDENVTLRPDPLRIVEDEHHILVSCPKCRYEIHCTESGNLDGCQKVSPDIKRQCSSGRHTDVSWVSERDDSDYGTHDARAGHGSNREERGTNDASDQKATNAGGTTPPSVTSRVMKWNDYLVNTPRRHESRPSTSPEKPVRRLSLQGIGVTQGGVELIDQPGCPWTESQSLRTENKALSRRLAEDHARHQNEISYLRSERYRLTLALTQEQENVEEGTRQISRLENSLASLGAQRMRRHRREQQQADLESSQGWSFWSAFAGVTW